MTRNIRQDLANFSRQGVRDLSVSALEATYSKVAAQRREADEQAERELNLNIPHFEKVKRLLAQELEQMATEENAHLPITDVFSAIQVVKASRCSENDIGVRALAGILNNMWKKDREASITAGTFTTLSDHFKRNYPKSAVVGVLEEIGRKGYMSLEMSKLAALAEDIGSQEDYERVILENGLQGNQPHCVKARKFILALVNESPEPEEEEEVAPDVKKFRDLYKELREKKQRGDKIGNTRPFDKTAQDDEELEEEPFDGSEDAGIDEEEFDSEWGKYDSPLAKDLWEKSMESWQDDEVGSTTEGPGTWAALFKDEKAILYSDSQGFISVDEFDDESSLMQHWEMLQKELAFDPFDEGEEESEESDEDFV